MTPEQRLEELDQLLAEVTDEGDGMMLSEFDGFCTALVIGPEMILPSEWLKVVWGGDGVPEFKDEQQMQRVFDLLVGHYNDVAGLLAEPDVTFSPVYDQDERDGDVFWELWVSGFERGMRLRPDAWARIAEATVDGDLNDAGKAVAMMLVLADFAQGESKLTDEQAAILTEDVPATIADIVFSIQHWTSTQRQSEHFPSMAAANRPTPPRSTPKVGRNDPCPCGSGKKYKKCCGAN
jgi:uncharacterized protein